MNTTPRGLSAQAKQISELQKYLRSNEGPLGALLDALCHPRAVRALEVLLRNSALYELVDADVDEELRTLRTALERAVRITQRIALISMSQSTGTVPDWTSLSHWFEPSPRGCRTGLMICIHASPYPSPRGRGLSEAGRARKQHSATHSLTPHLRGTLGRERNTPCQPSSQDENGGQCSAVCGRVRPETSWEPTSPSKDPLLNSIKSMLCAILEKSTTSKSNMATLDCVR